MRRLALTNAVASFVLALTVAVPAQGQAPTQVTFSGSPQSPISSNVAIPAGRAMLWVSGTVPSEADPKAPAGSRERWGDTKAQARTILKTFETQLAGKGLSLKDVVYMRVYIAPDKTKGGAFDFQGWFDAYAEFFGTAQNPTKVSRSTIGVPQLVSPDWLIEIEAFAVYPADK
jgi:enamine deaminase RidA (YjgF/YER057c/UK114 family)